MGSFVETAWRCVKWIGNCIYQVVTWWGIFMNKVNSIVHSFLMRNQETIESADDPKTTGEVVAIRKEKDQLDEKANQMYETLSNNDKNTVDALLAKRDY